MTVLVLSGLLWWRGARATRKAQTSSLTGAQERLAERDELEL